MISTAEHAAQCLNGIRALDQHFGYSLDLTDADILRHFARGTAVREVTSEQLTFVDGSKLFRAPGDRWGFEVFALA